MTLAAEPRQRPSLLDGYGKYLAIARTAFLQQLSERASLIGRCAFYCLILLVFSCLWRTVFAAASAERAGIGRTPGDYVWYLAVTEWIMIAQPASHLDIEADVRNGDIAYQLARPMSYVGAKLAQAFGELALRLLLLAPVGLTFARVFSGEWAEPRAIALSAIAAIAAAIVLQLSYAAIGLSAIWMHDCTPVYLVWQKLLFVLGGLMVPISLYPAWLRRITRLLPFATLLNGPGQLVLSGDHQHALRLLFELGVWSIFGSAVLWRLERRARATLELTGG
jgi:ABC-2 type transport system permease protein